MDKIKELEKWLNQGYCLVIIRDGKVVFKSKKHGIESLFNLIQRAPENMGQATVLDKRIGRAAALLLVLGHIKEVITLHLSQAGREVFIKYNIKFLTLEIVQDILDKDGFSVCPFEKLAAGKEPREFYQILFKKFF